MHRARVIASTLIVITACSKRAPDEKPADRGAAGAPGAPAAGGALATLDGSVDCHKVLPAAMVERHLPKAMVRSPVAGLCDVSVGELGEPGAIDFNIVYECSVPLSDAEVADVLELAKGTPIPDLGRGASDDGLQLRAFDRDTACLLTVTYAHPVPKLVDFVRDALDVLTPELLRTAASPVAAGAPASTDGEVDCVQLVPRAVIDRFAAGAVVEATAPGMCGVTRGEPLDRGHVHLVISFDCAAPLDDAAAAVKAKELRGKPIAGLGRGAAGDAGEIYAIDQDTSCIVRVGSLEKEAWLVDLTRATLDALTPDRLRAATK